jgi:hypothetical protein
VDTGLSQLSDLNTSVKVAVENCNGTDASRDLAEVEIHCQEFIESLLKAKPLERLPELAQALLTLAEAVEKQGRDARDLRQLASLLQ